MQNHIDNVNKQKIILRILKFTFLFILIILILLGIFGLVLSGSIINDKVSNINKNAKNHYNLFLEDREHFFQKLNIPEEGTYYILGECYENDFYLAYAGELLTQNTIVYGDDHNKANGYWAIKIEDNVITEVWSSNYPLISDQLISYTIEEQHKKMRLFDSTSDSNVIGYYKAENTSSN